MTRPLLFNTIKSSVGNFNKYIFNKNKTPYVIKDRNKIAKQKYKASIRNKNKIKK